MRRPDRQDPPAPIACSLDNVSRQHQIERWQALAASLRAVRRDAARLELRYDAEPGVLNELRALAALESACCGFASWIVSEGDGCVVLVVTGESADAIDAVVAVLPTGPTDHADRVGSSRPI